MLGAGTRVENVLNRTNVEPKIIAYSQAAVSAVVNIVGADAELRAGARARVALSGPGN